MNPITAPSNVAQQIAWTESAIADSDARLSSLKQELRASARHALASSRKPLIIGGVALVALGLLLYPKRHAIAHRAQSVLHSPLFNGLLQKLPLIGVILPLLSSAKKQNDGQAPSGKATATALISALVPLLTRLSPYAPAGRRPSIF